MRLPIRFSAMLLGLALLAGCEGGLPLGGEARDAGTQAAGPEAAGAAAAAIEVTSLDAPASAESDGQAQPAGAVAAGQAARTEAAETATKPEAAAPEAAAAVPELTEPSPEVVKTPGQIACEKKRGRYVKVGDSFGYTCVQNTRDGGKSCRKASDCEGLCLARSMSCSPFTPVLGCQEIIQQDGLRVTQCVE